ncbi:MAG TPA: hypothetical protein VNU23_07885 [Candidatus Cybelea sp.]|jgi:hypothetical protein|nr:hypothetical protein [Candidatus Cybelea sp.]
MPNGQKAAAKRPILKYRRVELSSLRKGRRGKHHDIVEGILGELDGVQPGSALEIPLADVNGIGLANLRSAVHRASTSAGLSIQTLADEKNFYVWKTPA